MSETPADFARWADEQRRHEVFSRLLTLCVLMLKCEYATNKLSRAWLGSIYGQAARIVEICDDASVIAGLVDRAYCVARKQAAAETNIKRDVFPEVPSEGFRTTLADAIAEAYEDAEAFTAANV